MNVLFLTIGLFDTIYQCGVYPDLIRCFARNGHNVYTVSSREIRQKLPTELLDERIAKTLKVRIGNITKTGIVQRGISTILIERQYIKAIEEHFKDVKFDLVLYSTPPITLEGVVSYIKERDHSKTYLLLKDIFPQNAVDLRILSKKGIKGLLYKYFRRKESALYAVSDRIGCMSQANVDYVLKHNPEINPLKVEVCPNCIEVQDLCLSPDERIAMRKKYNLPIDRKIFVYGGNLGKPQDIPFIIECLRAETRNEEVFFFIVGDGTELRKLESFVEIEKPQNVRLVKKLPKNDYERMIAACDVGLLFLDHRFMIPNFPSRLLSYMQAGIPVLACTDKNTDVGEVIVDGKFGWWCESNSTYGFEKAVREAMSANLTNMGACAYRCLRDYYAVNSAYAIIEKHLHEATSPVKPYILEKSHTGY